MNAEVDKNFLHEALQSHVETLRSLGWEVALSEKTVNLYDRSKRGKIKKRPTVGVEFYEELRRPWSVFSPGVRTLYTRTSYKELSRAVIMFLDKAHKHAPRLRKDQ
jgi:hypothetical protein